MINTPSALDNLLNLFTDRFKRVNSRAIHFMPDTVLWKSINYVGAGDICMHVSVYW